MAQSQVNLKVLRYNPDQGPEPYTQTYQAPLSEGMMVLDALNYVRDEVDPTLAFRWSCRMGICGSCGMMVNGKPTLTCQDRVDKYGDREVQVAPLDNFPAIRDLVVDISDFMEKLQRVKAWLIRKEEKPVSEGEYLQTPQQRAVYEHHSACINCMLCYAACPVYGLSPEFIGPAAIALAYRYNMDSRDQGKDERRPIVSSPEGVWDCTFVGECSVVCPKGVMPAEAIQRSKLQYAKEWAFSILMPWSNR